MRQVSGASGPTKPRTRRSTRPRGVGQASLLGLLDLPVGQGEAVLAEGVDVQLERHAGPLHGGGEQQGVFHGHIPVRGSVPQERGRGIRGDVLLQGEEVPPVRAGDVLDALGVAELRLRGDDRVAQDQPVGPVQAQGPPVDAQRGGEVAARGEAADEYGRAVGAFAQLTHAPGELAHRLQPQGRGGVVLTDGVAQYAGLAAHGLKGAGHRLRLPGGEVPVGPAGANDDGNFHAHLYSRPGSHMKDWGK